MQDDINLGYLIQGDAQKSRAEAQEQILLYSFLIIAIVVLAIKLKK